MDWIGLEWAACDWVGLLDWIGLPRVLTGKPKMYGLVGLVGLVSLVGLIGLVWFDWVGLVGLVGLFWFGWVPAAWSFSGLGLSVGLV